MTLGLRRCKRFLIFSAVGSFIYVQVCTYLDITYIVRMLGRYLSNLRMDHWKALKRAMWYQQRMKDCMLIYKRLNQLETIGYSNFDFTKCQDNKKSTSCYIYLIAGGVISLKNAK